MITVCQVHLELNICDYEGFAYMFVYLDISLAVASLSFATFSFSVKSKANISLCAKISRKYNGSGGAAGTPLALSRQCMLSGGGGGGGGGGEGGSRNMGFE